MFLYKHKQALYSKTDTGELKIEILKRVKKTDESTVYFMHWNKLNEHTEIYTFVSAIYIYI